MMAGRLQQLLEAHWRRPRRAGRVLLWLPARFFQAASALRRRLYAAGMLKTRRLPVPVLVVGNIHAGGAGKTPVTAALVQALAAKGVKTGIISRGYGRTSRETHVLTPGSTAAEAGDEPMMLFRKAGVPVAVSGSRYAAGQALLAGFPDTQLIICDDGLQHYALAREAEIAVYPGEDCRRTPDVLPNGPLREPLKRLASVDAVVVVSENPEDAAALKQQARLPERVFTAVCPRRYGRFYRAAEPSDTADAAFFAGKTAAAAAAVARPERFFEALRAQGIKVSAEAAWPDHALPDAAIFPEADVLFVTEKDAVKLPAPIPERIWVLPMEVVLPEALIGLLRRKTGV